MEGVLAVVTCFAADFAPRGWAYCNGQLLAISTNQALFSLLGTTFGGNGIQTFGLPDLRSRVPVSTGQGGGLTNYVLGQQGGAETASVTINSMPSHTHNGNLTLTIDADSSDGGVPRAVNTYPAKLANSYAAAADGVMATPTYNVTIGTAGGSVPVSVLSPYLAMNYIICLQGIFPSRN